MDTGRRRLRGVGRAMGGELGHLVGLALVWARCGGGAGRSDPNGAAGAGLGVGVVGHVGPARAVS